MVKKLIYLLEQLKAGPRPIALARYQNSRWYCYCLEPITIPTTIESIIVNKEEFYNKLSQSKQIGVIVARASLQIAGYNRWDFVKNYQKYSWYYCD